MKKISCLLIILFLNSIINAQNLVPNGDFETFTQLPSGSGAYSFCTGWSNCGGTGSPDYFHLNGTGLAQLPNNFISTVYPHGGSAVMGLNMYYSNYPD